MSYKIYLSGPMTNLKARDVIGWREELTERLTPLGIECFSPLRHKDFLDDNKPMKAGKYGGFKDTPSFILGRDYNDCTTADIVVVNFTGCRSYSNGTAMEIAWAYALHIPIVLIGEDDNPNVYHPMVSAACQFKVADLAEARDCITTILFP